MLKWWWYVFNTIGDFQANQDGENLDLSRRNNAGLSSCNTCTIKYTCSKNPGPIQDDNKPSCHVEPRPALQGSAARREFGDSRF
jgi:hypothetical protein